MSEVCYKTLISNANLCLIYYGLTLVKRYSKALNHPLWLSTHKKSTKIVAAIFVNNLLFIITSPNEQKCSKCRHTTEAPFLSAFTQNRNNPKGESLLFPIIIFSAPCCALLALFWRGLPTQKCNHLYVFLCNQGKRVH